ncbi:MAG: flagellar hook-basal body complex protein [Pseudomonadota bacterium]
MTLSSSLSAGVAGLQANATRLAVISDNIANSSTAGYRRGDVDFNSLVLQESRLGSYSAGGVRAQTFREVSSSGTLIGSSNATDIAVSGRGFLPVTTEDAIGLPANERPFLLTPTGGFDRSASGHLVTRSGLALTGWPTDVEGNLIGNVVRDSPNDLEPVQVSQFLTISDPTTAVRLSLNVPAADTVAGSAGAPYSTVVEYFDGVGRREELTAVFTPTVPATGTSDTWTLDFFDSAGADPSVALDSLTLTFDSSRTGRGELATVTAGTSPYDPATGILTLTVDGGPIEVFIGSDTVDGGITQIDAGFSPIAIEANGSPAGNLSNLEVDSQGFLRGVYDTGQVITLYQIPVVDVPNPNALNAENNQTFSLSAESGRPFLWDANTGPVGGVAGFSLQESTVDIARELTGLIETQRAYSSNATVVQTVDEMLQETTNLKR